MKKLPYLDRVTDYKGEDHYEEKNSAGINSAGVIAETFDEILQKIDVFME